MKSISVTSIILIFVLGTTIFAADPLNIEIPGIMNPDSSQINTLNGVYEFLSDNKLTYFNSDNTAKQPINIILLDTIDVSDDSNKPHTGWCESRWSFSGTDVNPITIKSEDGHKYAINRYTDDSELNLPLIIFENLYNTTIRIEYITIKDIKFNNAAACLGFIRARYCNVNNCDFIINEFLPRGGGGVITLSTWDADAGPIVNSSSNNLIDSCTFDFRDESVLDIHFRDEDDSLSWNSAYFYHAIYLSHCDNNEISENTFYNAPGGCIHAFHNYTIENDILDNTINMCYSYNYKLRSPKLDLDSPPYAPYVGNWDKVNERRWGIIIADENETSVNNNIVGNKLHGSGDVTPNWYSPVSDNIFVIHDSLVSVTDWDSNDHDNNYSHCQNDEDDYLERYNSRYNSDDIKIYRFDDTVGDTLYIVDEGIGKIIKVDGLGGSGTGMFSDGNELGTHEFDKTITATEYDSDNEFLFIGFSDGSIIKLKDINKASGDNMFHVSDTTYGFYNEGVYEYCVGSHKFWSGIRHIKCINGFTFVSFENDKLLKINGAGGGGSNLFAITETSAGFDSIATYKYYEGDAKFNNKITCIAYIDGKSFWAFEKPSSGGGAGDPGKLLKIDGTGGSGHNMFAVNETSNGFSSVDSFYYYLGYDTFDSSHVTYIKSFGSGSSAQSLFCLSDGKILKIKGNNGTGGTGSNMFAVNETDSNFTSMACCDYYEGDHKYSGYVTDIVEYEGKYFIAFHDGKLRRFDNILNSGCEGSEMFDGTTLANGYKDGWNTFFATITDLEVVDSYLFISLMHGRVLKMEGEGYCYGDTIAPIVNNMFNIVEKPFYYKPIKDHWKYNIFKDKYDNQEDYSTYGDYLMGWDNIKDTQNPFYKGKIKRENNTPIRPELFQNFPNPFNPSTIITFNLPKSEKVKIDVFNIRGQKVKNLLNKKMKAGSHTIEFNARNYATGLYFYRIQAGEFQDVKKMILVK
jgi:hypothetical protein